MKFGNKIEIERRNRILVSIAAYAYEIENDAVLDDATYDKLASEINPSLDTGNTLLDDFFLFEFSPDTGQWIHDHPELDKIKKLYDTHHGL